MEAEQYSVPPFGPLLRQWRACRRLSQLELAGEAEVSARHLSFLETGRARPSREMVQRLANALEMPLRDRNALMLAAGLAPAHEHASLDDAEMARYREAIQWTLDKQEPYPALVMDRHWNIVTMNGGSQRFLLGFLPEPRLRRFSNAMELLFARDGLQPYVENWDEVASAMLARIHREHAHAPGDGDLAGLYSRLASSAAVPENWRAIAAGTDPGPVLPLVLRKGESISSLFSTITTFGTPHDITLQELRIECFFPADGATRELLDGLSEGAHS